MNMHRTGERADWAAVAPAARGSWQRLAARTRGVVTPGNLVSTGSFCLVVAGLALVARSDLALGTSVVGLGRLGDTVDGMIAEKTGTKSPLGQALDAALDKMGALSALAVFTARDVLPVWVAAAIMAQNVANVVIGLYAPWRRTTTLNPSAAGKVATAGFWITIIIFVAARLLDNPLLLTAAYALAALALALGVYASINYALAAAAAPRRRGAKTVAYFRRYLVLRNPVSTGVHRADRRIAALQRLEAGKPFTVLDTLPGGQGPNAALLRRYADSLGKDTLLCIAAGDGTINMVLDILLNDPALPDAARDTPILPLWCGNANDLAYMLNGWPTRSGGRKLLRKGRVVTIYPLTCVMTALDGTVRTRLAASYASFGWSAFSTRELERTMRSKHSLVHRIAISRFGLEFIEVWGRHLLRAPRFTITDAGGRKTIFERLLINGSRFAKVGAIPLRLTDRYFYRATAEQKSLPVLLYHIAEVLNHRRGRRFATTEDSFTVHNSIWAQFDGEPVKVPKGTHISVTIAKRPFRALTTKLRAP